MIHLHLRAGGRQGCRTTRGKRAASGLLAAVLLIVAVFGGGGSALAAPLAPTAAGGVESVTVTGFTAGADLELYLTNGTSVAVQPNEAGPSYTFANVQPTTMGYYVTQTVVGSESVNSGFVYPSLRTPVASAGVGYVDAANVYPGATVTLYGMSGNPVSSSPTDMGNGTFRFSGLPGRSEYYLAQSIGGVQSEGSNIVMTQRAVPAAPTAANGEERITASGFESGADLKLYLTNGTLKATQLNATGSEYTFASVVPSSIGYYVTQTVGGEESMNSNFAEASLRTPTASAGIGYVDAGNVFPGATVTLYDASGAFIANDPEDRGDGTYRFEAVTARTSYYVVQSIGGVLSLASNLATAMPAIPSAPTAVGGEESIVVSGYAPGAALKLYLTDGTPVATQPNVPGTSYTFANVAPSSLGYYATQTVGGEESLNSSFASPSLRTPTASAGIGYVDVGNVYPGASVTLYDAGGTAVPGSPADQGGGVVRFEGLPARSGYYAMQSFGGVASAASAIVSVLPAIPNAPTAGDGEESIVVSGYAPGATLKLYLTDGTLKATQANVPGTSYAFTNVAPSSLGYYATQTVGGEESVNSSFASASLRTPTASAGIGYVDVGNVYPGATLALHDAGGTLVPGSPTDQGGGIVRYAGLTARSQYYAVQSFGGVQSEATSLETVLPAIPAAPAAAGGVERIEASGYAPGAALTLYLADGTPVASKSNAQGASSIFADVPPDTQGYYVTQTVAGEESANSGIVTISLRTPAVVSGIGFADVGSVYPGATIELYEIDGTAVTGVPADQGDGTFRFGGLTAGREYYAVQKFNGVLSAGSNIVKLPTVPGAPTGVTATAGDGQATVAFAAPEENGGSAITEYEVTASPGNLVKTVTTATIAFTGLDNGTSYTFTVKAVNGVGKSAASDASNVVTPQAPYRGDPAANYGANVLVNGDSVASSVTQSSIDGRSRTTVTIDQAKLADKLTAEGQGAEVAIQVTNASDAVAAELNGQTIRDLAANQAVLKLITPAGTYTIPADRIDLDALLGSLGNPAAAQDIKVLIEIAAPEEATLKLVQEAAAKGEFTLVAPPLNFTITASYGGRTADVSAFRAYVERSVALPASVDPEKITTGVVVDPDGAVRHVPTRVIAKDGKYYAQVNSLTNSTYAVVWHPYAFGDMTYHWAKNAVNDMGARLIIDGIGGGAFGPDRTVTRAEFAAILVRGLGLKPEIGASPFADVRSSDWYAGAINAAYAYRLVTGFADGNFRPNDGITREQAMAIIAKAMPLTGLAGKLAATSGAALQPFGDAADVSAWALDGVAGCVEAGVVTGTGGALAPQALLTRAETAAILQRLLQKSGLI
ncbi:S-layer homology domain-containing protein [Paenibacillus glycinis]|uniref:S-layer homology domain-containing protein n=1 Tax=Paenibacillus glycinis TaxID=2697035 RepID=A0ABW9XSP3_9BACL|nr:S-layer homology domain-containing protein [Paenibacillus glycinis]NBD25674.1 hypothetical protein [Paenibacillus glycinis]